MVRDIKDRFDLGNVMVVSPDVGGVVRARGLAKRINTPLAIIDKRRERAGESEVMNVIGDCAGYTCILIDDIVDSGGTLVNAADALLANGAKEVYAYISHGVLSGGAAARIAGSKLKELVITDSIQATEAVRNAANIRTLSIAGLIGEAIGRTAAEESVSSCSTSTALQGGQRRTCAVPTTTTGHTRFAGDDNQGRGGPRAERSLQIQLSNTACRQTRFRDLAALRPRFEFDLPPPETTRGCRESRVRAAPAVSRAKGNKQKRTRAYRFSGEHPAFPAQWFYGLLRDLPGEPSSIATVTSQIISAKLGASVGRPNHATSPSARVALVSRNFRVHRIPPRVRDDSRSAPLIG